MKKVFAIGLLAVLIASQAFAVEFTVPNTQVALIVLSSDDGTPIDTRYNGRPDPVWAEDADVIGLDANIVPMGGEGIPDGVPICTVGTRDGGVGSGEVTVSATVDGEPLSTTFTVNVTDGVATIKSRGNDSRFGHGGRSLVVTILLLVDKP